MPHATTLAPENPPDDGVPVHAQAGFVPASAENPLLILHQHLINNPQHMHLQVFHLQGVGER